MSHRLSRALPYSEADGAELGEDAVLLLVDHRRDVAERSTLAPSAASIRSMADAIAALQLEPERLHGAGFPADPAPETRVCAFSSSPDLSATRVGETDATIASVLTATVRSERALAWDLAPSA